MSIYSDINYIKPSLGAKLYDIDSVFQSVFTILGTKKGERVFRPNFGLSMNNYLFEPCDEMTARTIYYDISNVMSLEPRVKFNTAKSSVVPVPERSAFIITLYFTIYGFSDTEKSLNLVLKTKERR